MSEIRERAQEWIKNETDSCWLFDCLGEEEGQQCVDAGYVIRDLLAEMERVVSENNDLQKRLFNALIDTRLDKAEQRWNMGFQAGLKQAIPHEKELTDALAAERQGVKTTMPH